MGVVTNTKQDRSWNILFMAGLLLGLILRFYLASFAKMPGHGDSAFYYTVARNIALGRGPVVDYIVYFFSGLLPLPHYAGDFWNPSASYLIAIPMILFGKTISSALIAPILFGLVPALVGYLAGRKYSNSIVVGALAGILTFFTTYQVWVSVLTEAIIFSGAFASVAIYMIMKSDGSPRYFMAAALFTGLANLIRQDNILLLATLEICILVAALPWKKKLALAGIVLVIHLLVLSPLLVKNYIELHSFFPPGPGKTAFLTTYEDFHSYGKQLDWNTLRATYGIRGLLELKLHTALENLNQVRDFINPYFGALLLVALGGTLLIRKKLSRLRLLLPVFTFAILEYLFYTFVASYSGPGSLVKSLGTLLPFFCILIVDFFGEYLRPNALKVGTVILLSAYLGYQGFQANYSSTIYYNGVYEQYKTVRSIVTEDAGKNGGNTADITIMARNTWDVYEGTGFKTVMIPNNDLETIIQVAGHYGVDYILLPAPRKVLDSIYQNKSNDPRFVFIAQIPGSDMKIFRILVPK